MTNKCMIISWFSCGAASAVATKIALQTYENVVPYYIALGGEHEDNFRFLKDCEKWFEKKINIVEPVPYKSHWEVIEKKRMVNSIHGAACTSVLKINSRYKIEDEIKEWDGQIFGFDVTEKKRAKRFSEQYPKSKAIFPLIDNMLSKEDCLALLVKAKIKLPRMYELGFWNNNCIGCVKGGKGYWSRIRHFFPDAFYRMAQLERNIGHSCLNGCFLDELPKNYPMNAPIIPECSLFCDVDFMDV